MDFLKKNVISALDNLYDYFEKNFVRVGELTFDLKVLVGESIDLGIYVHLEDNGLSKIKWFLVNSCP